MLAEDDFAAFFQEVHGHEPFPWQRRLLQRVADQGLWPAVLDLPTGSGKTAAMDIAVFHLALESDRGDARRAPVRIAFVVDRRLVVDDAFARAGKLEEALRQPKGPATSRVAERLRALSGDGPPLIARRLRGGIPREDDWARTPAQPTILCSTVDQVGSRLLFRGYGVSDAMKPVHAGLIGSDCLILLDEAHLAEPFRQTLQWIELYRGHAWRETAHAAPWGVALLTATPGTSPRVGFALDEADQAHPVLHARLSAAKPARLVEYALADGDQDLGRRTTAIVAEVKRALEHLTAAGIGVSTPAIGVVVNRVARARAVFQQLSAEVPPEDADRLLLIGPARPLDRDSVADQLAPIRTGAERALEKPLILVATQCIEVGVDIDLDALITEAAPLDALRQRFGRLNRAGRNIRPYAAILAAESDLSHRAEDPVYGKAIRTAWECLTKAGRKEKGDQIVEFGLNGFAVAMVKDALSPKEDAPVLLPAHLDLLSQTSPIPAADPDVALYLHGPTREPDSITVVWRADIDPDRQRSDEVRSLLLLVPPRAPEAIELPLWAVRRWLRQDRQAPDRLADAATVTPEVDESPRDDRTGRLAFRWAGDEERSRWITPSELRPGDTVVVPAAYGGVDAFGWNPEHHLPATDLGREAARAFAGRRLAVRVAPGLLGEVVSSEALAETLAVAASRRWSDLRAAVLELALPEPIRKDLDALDHARAGKVVVDLDCYGADDEGRPRGVVFLAPLGIEDGGSEKDGPQSATEDDTSGSMPGFRLTLLEHSQDVAKKAESFARAAGLPAGRVTDLELAGLLHDLGKVDRRFQAWLDYGDPLGPDPSEPGQFLAKSGRPLPRAARAASGLPEHWRHEALSVRLAPHVARFEEAQDPELVLWLIGTHHGHGRPFFPHADPLDATARALPCLLGLPVELPPAAGPQSLAFDWQGLDWPTLFARVKARYGVWELARLEAILRLADHRASEERAAVEGAQ